MATIEQSPDELIHDLANGLRANMSAIRRLAEKPRHIPGDDAYHALAKRLVERMKIAGVEKVTRRVSVAHSAPGPGAG